MVGYQSKLHSSKAKFNSNALPSEVTIEILDDDCLIHIFELLSIADRVKVERGKY